LKIGHLNWDLPVTQCGIARSIKMGLAGHVRWDFAVTCGGIKQKDFIDIFSKNGVSVPEVKTEET